MAFQIKPNKRESENKTIRFPLELVERVNKTIDGHDVSFSNFVIQAVEYALPLLFSSQKFNKVFD